MSTPKINPTLNPSLASKSLYEEKAEEFIKRKNPLGTKRSEATAAPATQLQQDTDVGGCAVIESLSSALKGVFGIFQGRPEITPLGEVVVDSRELTKDLEVAEEISPQMFGLILDDHAIGDTTFEGVLNMSTTIDYMGSVLAKNKDRFEALGLDVDGFIRKFAFPSGVAHDLETLFQGKKDLNGQEQEAVLKELKKIGDHISEAVQNLASGESLLLPGGWKDKKSAHAILYEVKRNEQGTYSFAVYNTGEGLENHPSVLHDSKEKFQGYIEIEGIAYDKITSANFYKTLFEVGYFNSVKPDTQTETKGPDEVYLGLLTSLGGNEKKFHPGHLGYRSGQRSGTCAWKCLMEALRQSCTSYEQYRRLKVLVQCQTLVDFTKTLEKMDFKTLSIKENQTLEHLLEVSSEKIGRSLTKSFDKGWISQKELEEGFHLVEQLKSFYVAPAPSVGIVEEQSPAKNTELKRKQEYQFSSNCQNIDHRTKASIAQGMPSISQLNFQDSDALDAQIANCYEVFTKLESVGSPALRGLEILTASIMQLPVPKKGVQDVWDALPESEIDKRTEQLRLLVRLMSFMVNQGGQGCPPIVLLCTHHLIAVLDKLTKRSKESKLPDVPVYAGLLKEFNGVGFILPTKAMQEYREAIESYFEASNPDITNRLFSFAARDGEGCRPFRMLNDFAKGDFEVPADSLSQEYYLDKAYLDSLLSDPTILQKLSQEGIHTQREKEHALLEDFTKYLPAVDGRLKESVLLARLMQNKLRPTFGNIYRDDQATSRQDDQEPGDQLKKLLPRTYKDYHGQVYVSSVLFNPNPYDNNNVEASDLRTKYSNMMVASKKAPLVSVPGGSTRLSGVDILAPLWLDSQTKERAPPLVRELSHAKLSRGEYLSDKKDLANQVVLQDHHKDSELSFEETLHIRLMNIDEKDAPWRLLAFLEEHFDAFQDKGVQMLLMGYLYQSPMTKILEEQPLFINKLLSQALHAYDRYEQDGDIETAAFILQYLKRVEGRYEELFSNTDLFSQVDYKGKFAALTSLAGTSAKRAVIEIALGLSYYQGAYLDKPFTSEMGQAILRATFILQNRYQSPEDDRHHQLYRQELRYLQTRYRLEIAELLDTQDIGSRNAFLNALIGEPELQRQWEGSYPDYTSNYLDKKYHYNIVRGEISVDGGIIKQRRPIAPEILKEYGFSEETEMDSNGVYYSPDRNKRLWKPSENHSQEVVCEYKINRGWLAWVPLEKRNRDGDIEQKLEFDLFKSLGLNTVNGYYHHLVANKLLLTDTQKNPIYEADYKSERFIYTQKLSSVTKTLDDKIYHLVDFENAKEDLGFQSLMFMQEIVDPGLPLAMWPTIRLTLWQGADGEERLLEVDNGLVSFKKKGPHYECTQHPGYLLTAPKQETLYGFMDYIHLTHETSGKEKIILLSPTGKVKATRTELGNFFPALVFDDKPQVFNLDKEGAPIIKTSKDCMWISYAALVARDYGQAMHYLVRAEELGASDAVSITLLSRILSVSDNHPDAINCKMLASCLLKKNALLYGAKQEMEQKEKVADALFPMGIYLEYLSTYNKGKLNALPEHLEKLLWRNLSEKRRDGIAKHTPLLDERHKTLETGEEGELVRPLTRVKNSGEFSQKIKDEAFSNKDDFFPPDYYRKLDTVIREEKEKTLIADKALLPFLGAGKGFRTHFLAFYEDAKNSSPELAERLKVMRGETDDTNRYLAWYLEQVMVNPSAYPNSPQLFGSDFNIRMGISSFISSLKYKSHSHLTKGLFDLTRSSFPQIPGTSLLQRVMSFIKTPEPNPLQKFIDDLNQEEKISGKSDTEGYHIQSAHSEVVLDLALTKEVLFHDPITSVDQTLVENLESKILETSGAMQSLEQEALTLAAKLPQDPSIASLIQMKRLGHLEGVLTMEDLVALFVVGQQRPYLDQTYLTQKGVQDLELAIGQYLQQKILKNHAEASLEAYSDYNKATAEDKEYCLKKVLQLVNEKPQYEPKDHREYLVFEAMSGLRLRLNQIEKLDLLSPLERTSIVLHMIMGDGKSTVITPIVALLLARKGFLPFIVVPDSLHKTGKETTKLTVFQSFGKHAHPFEIQRDSDFSKEKLKTLAESMHQWKKDKGFIYTTRESLLSFLLKSKELFYQYEETKGVAAKKELEECIELAWGILREIKQSGAALLDEAHSLLNCRDELNFTFGRSKHIERQEAAQVFDILEFLITDPTMKQLLDIEHNNQAKMSHETYDSEVKPVLIQKLATQFGVDEAYFYDNVDEVPADIESHEDRDLIALGKVVVSTFLPHTLTKKRDEHYGLGSTHSYCIPYVGNNTPNEKAEFASYLETLLYTGYYYSQQGLTVKQLRDFRDECLVKCQKEQMFSKIPASETKVNAIFKRITGQPLSRIFDEEKAKEYFKEHPESVFEYCLEKVVPEIVVFPSKLSANPHHLVAVFNQADAMTGTPWNKDAYPSQFTTAEEEAIDLKSVGIVKRVASAELVILQTKEDKQMLQEIIQAFIAKPDCRAVIDAGALIKDISNEEVAKELLRACNPQDVDGIAYYDQENELKVLERLSGKSVMFKDSLIPKERRVTFYDQRHTLGSDITQKRDGRALVTLSETVKKFELFQAIWRMREIDRGQTLTFLIPQSITPLIASDGLITADKVLDFVTSNQKEQELFDNFRSRKLEIKAIVEEAMHDALMQASNFSQRLKIFSKTKELLMEPLDIAPFDAFGGIEKEEEATKLLKETTDKWLGILDDLAKRGAIKDPSKYREKIEGLRDIPLNSKYRATKNSIIDTQIEKQVEVQVQLTVATKPDVYQENIMPWNVWQWPKSLNIFKDDWMRVASWWRSPEMPLYEASDVVRKSSNTTISSMSGVFNDSFLISNNFLPQKVKSRKEIKAEPFAWYSKPVYHLVVTEEANGQIKTLMIDQNDLLFFRDKLLQDEGQENRKICIYDPTIGITLQGKRAFDEKALKENPDFIKHLVYSKFWNGSSKYTPQETEYLESWIRDQGAQRMFDFFQAIVRNKDDSVKDFNHSPLSGVFEKLLTNSDSVPSRKRRADGDDDSFNRKRPPVEPVIGKASSRKRVADPEGDDFEAKRKL